MKLFFFTDKLKGSAGKDKNISLYIIDFLEFFAVTNNIMNTLLT